MPGKAQTNYNPKSATPITFVPQLTEFFDTWPSGWKGAITRTWIFFFQSLQRAIVGPTPIIGFWMPGIAPGTNVGPMLASGRGGNVTMVVVVVKASDPSTNLSFDFKQNGVSIFATPPVIAAATAAGTELVITNLTSNPLAVAQDDVFTLDILTGTTSWFFTAQLQNAIVPTQ